MATVMLIRPCREASCGKCPIVVSRDYLFMSWLANHRALLSHTPRSHRSPPYCPTNKRVRYDRHQRKTKGIHMKKTDLLQEWLNDALGVHVTVIPGIQKGLQAFSFIHFQNTFPFVQTHVYLVWLLGFPLAPVHFCFYIYDFLLIPEQFYAVQEMALAKCMSFLTLPKCRDIRQILIGNIGWNIAQTCCFRHDA